MLRKPKAKGNVSSPTLDTALSRAVQEYARRGWHVLQCRPRTKKAVLKAWQSLATTDLGVVEDWWARRPRCNVGVQLGPKSGLIDVECDSDEAEHELGALLAGQAPVVPTFQSSRGKHRLFLWSQDLPCPDKAVFKFRGIEFRTGNGGKGAQSLFPPSIHPDGLVYKWLVSPDEADPAPFAAAALSIIRAAMDAYERSNTEDPEDTENAANTAPPPLEPSAPCCVLLRSSVLQAIESTLPTEPGQRHEQVFALCRMLKALPDLASADLGTLRPIVVEWHRRALPVITTRPFSDTWADFIEGWPRVKYPAGEGVLETAFKRAGSCKPPAKAVAMYNEPPVLLLASLCRELQRFAGAGPFFLDCRTAGRLVGIHHTTAWRLLTIVLPADGILEGGAKGSKATRKANEYRYVAD